MACGLHRQSGGEEQVQVEGMMLGKPNRVSGWVIVRSPDRSSGSARLPKFLTAHQPFLHPVR